jgi:hypothetical protein
MGRTSALDAALVALAQEPEHRDVDLASALTAASPELVQALVDHGLAGLAATRVREIRQNVPALCPQLNAARAMSWSNHLTMVADLGEVAAALDGIHGGWALVKGPVLAELAYGRADLRSYVDLDVLVHPASFGEALRRLTTTGADLLDRNWELIRSSMRAELSLELNQRTPIDLHWHLINEAPLRRRTTWRTSDLLERRTTAQIGEHTVPVLDETDALMHVAVHACRSGAHRLVWLKDIERLIATHPPDYPELERRARAAKLWPHVDLALSRSAAVFGFPLPFRHTAWTRLNRSLGCGGFRTTGRLFATGRSLAEACRTTTAGSAAALTTATVANWHWQWAQGHHPIPGLPPPPAPVEELRRPAGAGRDRDAYLTEVATSAPAGAP